MSAYAERLRFGLSDSLVLARRNLSHIRQIPEKLIDVTVQPLMFVILFAYVFGGAIAIPGGGDYHEYLMAGIFIQTLTFGVMGPATSMATDLGEGILDRFRSLPMARSAFLIGHVLAEFAAAMLALTVMTRRRPRRRLAHPHRRARTPLAGFGLLALVAFTMLWLGIAARDHRARARRGHRDRLHRHLPADLRGQRLRPGRHAAGRPAHVRRLEPDQRAGRRRSRTLFGNPTAAPADAAWPLQHPVVSALLWCAGLLAVDGAAGHRVLSPAHGGVARRGV